MGQADTVPDAPLKTCHHLENRSMKPIKWRGRSGRKEDLMLPSGQRWCIFNREYVHDVKKRQNLLR